MDVTEAVSVIVPAYRPGAAFQDTLRSLAAQTYPDVRVLVSLDHAPDHILPDLPPMGRVRLDVSMLPERRGWVGNVNALLGQVTTPYFVIVSHDDRLTATYIEAAMDVLRTRPEVIGAHGSVRLHGLNGGLTQTTDDIAGDRLARVTTFIERGPHQAHMAWRSVHRRQVIDRGIHLRARRSDGLFSDQLWVLETLLHGATANVPGIFYDKYTTADGLVATWRQRSAADKATGVADNIARTAEVLATAGFPADTEERILTTWVEWLLRLQGDWSVLADVRRSDGLTVADVRPALSRLFAMVALEGRTHDLAPTIASERSAAVVRVGRLQAVARRLRRRLPGGSSA